MSDHPAHLRKEIEFIARSPKFSLEKDLILSASTRLQLDEALAKVRHHRTIYETWNFASVDPMGTGTVLNFYGPTGTGKTMAAEAFAGTLGLQFIHVGIAEIESKFMGETAKNIQRAFQAAHRSSAIILFDEADTLLGKRLTSVTQGIDNEVNSMRSTLLIELERFEGIAIFATNFAQNYDEAFRSRITHHLRFELPDAAARSKLWRKMILPTIPLRGDLESIVHECTVLSEGFSGREIRTCMRLSLPKTLLESERTGCAAELTLSHLIESITQVRTASKDVAAPARERVTTDATVVRSLLGIANPEGEM